MNEETGVQGIDLSGYSQGQHNNLNIVSPAHSPAIEVEVTVQGDCFRFAGAGPFTSELRGAFKDWLGAVTGVPADAIQHSLTHLEALMADQTVRLDRLDAATTKIATVLQELRDAAVNGMSPADAARFDATIATLEAMGADPANPLPELPPA